VGKFLGGDDALDIVSSSGEPNQMTGEIARPKLWFIRGSGMGAFNPSDASAVDLDSGEISRCLEGFTPAPGCFIWDVADLDLSPPAEVVGIDVADFCEGRPNPRSRLFVLGATSTGSTALTCQRVVLAPARGRAEELQLADLDRDGKSDLIVRFD